MTPRFATLTFERRVEAPLATLWQAWTAPAAREVWAPPGPGVTVTLVSADPPQPGGREVTLCRAEGYPDIRAEVRWLHLDPGRLAVNSEVISSDSGTDGAALVTAAFHADGPGASRIALTVQLAALADGMEDGYRHGYGAGIGNLAGVAGRTMILTRDIAAPVAAVWGAWWSADSLPLWWGPDGFTCRTSRIDLRAGGEWVFDMIAPDGTVFPNHHRYGAVLPERMLSYSLHRGENGPEHARAWAAFDPVEGGTRVTLGMVMATAEEWRQARGFGAEALGQQTLGKLARASGAG